MKIVLALCPVWDSLTPNLALAYLKGSLQNAGYSCKVIDFSVQFRPNMVSVFGDRKADEYVTQHPKLYKSWAQQIAIEKPDVVGFSLLGSNQNISEMVAAELQNLLPGVFVIAGGPTLTPQNDNSISRALNFCDYVIEGEGEQAIVDVVKCFEQKGDFKKLKQLWYLGKDGTAQYTGSQPLQNINDIPYPDFTDFNRNQYVAPRKLPMLFSRGCILNCNYCENKWNHLTQRSRDGRNVFDELKHHVNKYGINEYMFNDDSLISSKTMRQLDEYCDLVIAEGLAMPWGVYGTRVERLITVPFLKKLRASGMERVTLGVESFSSKVQKEMGKSSRYDEADRMCRMFVDEGIRTESWIIYGYPTETDADFDETLNWFIKNPNVLSHITANAFGPNAKYMTDRPGIVTYKSGRAGDWVGGESTLQNRKARFLRLIEVLESIRVARNGAFTYHVGDPLYVSYFNRFRAKDKRNLLNEWEKIENPLHRSPKHALENLFRKFLFQKSIQPATLKHDPIPPQTPLLVGDINEMRKGVYAKIEAEINKNTALTDEKKIEKIHHYITAINNIKLHLTDNVTEEIFFAMVLNGNITTTLADLDFHAPEYIAQKTLEASEKFILPVRYSTK